MQVTGTARQRFGVECIECVNDERDHGTYAKVSEALRAARAHARETADHYPQVVTR